MKTTGRLPDAPVPDLRQRLNEELARRCARNGQYSLRAFAKFLAIDHSTLSQLLRRKRSFSAAMTRKLGARLGLGPDDVALLTATTAMRAPAADVQGERVLELTRDATTIITDWRHLAILELLRLEAFQPDSRWIARMLGITVDEVNVALQRLMHLGMLEMKGTHEWVDCCGDAVLETGQFTTITLARLGAELAALAGTHAHPGHHRTSTVALDSRQLNAVTDLLERFRRDLAELQRTATRHDAVYRIDVSLMPLTRVESPTPES